MKILCKDHILCGGLELNPQTPARLDPESSAFGAHRIHDDGNWDGDFKDHLVKYSIKPILARVKHPQTNGKLESFRRIQEV